MGRRGASRKGSVADEDGSDAASSSTCAGTGCDEFQTDADAFHQYIEDTYEKRGSTREAAFNGLAGLLRSDVRVDECQRNESTLLARCVGGVRKGGPVEAAVAAVVAGLHVLTLASPSEERYAALQPALVKLGANSGSSEDERIAAVESLAIACFVASEDEASAVSLLEALAAVWRKAQTPARVRSAALRAWSFLFTSVSPRSFRGNDVEDLLAELADLLSVGDVEVRASAGEAIALLYQQYDLNNLLLLDGHDDDGDDDDDEYGGGDGRDAAALLAADEEEVAAALFDSPGGGGASSAALARRASLDAATAASSNLDDVVDRMRELATNGKAQEHGNMRRSRRDRAALRHTFRGLCSTLEDGAVPEVRLKLRHGDVLVVQGLTDVIRLNFLRRFLAGGFQPHLQSNTLLHALFDYAPECERAPRMSSVEKRLFRSPQSGASKGRAQERRAQRSTKAAARH